MPGLDSSHGTEGLNLVGEGGSGCLRATSHFSEDSFCSSVEWECKLTHRMVVRPEGEGIVTQLGACPSQFLPYASWETHLSSPAGTQVTCSQPMQP